LESLLLITHEYPINKGDSSFIKNEIPYLASNFDKIHILCKGIIKDKNEILAIPDNCSVNFIKRKYNIISIIIFIIQTIFNSILYLEINQFLKDKKKSFKTLSFILSYLFKAIVTKKHIMDIVKKDKNISIIYTYWYYNESLGALLYKKLNNKIKCITRAHGYDVHLFENKYNYQPYKIWMDKNIDKIFFASQYLCDYYKKIFAKSGLNKYITMPLGIINNSDICKIKKNNDVFILLSCSYIVPRKRINLIIEALSYINDINIHWIHIGNDPDTDNILSIADELLKTKNNISYDFKGLMSSEQIMQFYNENYIDFFISTTEAEGGRPVSINEAMSFGIPIIATNTGGIPELIENIGILIDVNCKAIEISESIINFYNLFDDTKLSIRHKTRLFWENNCNAESNYPKFINEIKLLSNN